MTAVFKPCKLSGKIDAPPSKSMAHRYLIGAALSGRECILCGVDYSEDILASIDCLRALGANVIIDGDRVTVNPDGFMKAKNPVLECRESGSTLRFFIPLALCMGNTVTLRGAERLFERPLSVYAELCAENGFSFEKNKDFVTLCGNLDVLPFQKIFQCHFVSLFLSLDLLRRMGVPGRVDKCLLNIKQTVVSGKVDRCL